MEEEAFLDVKANGLVGLVLDALEEEEDELAVFAKLLLEAVGEGNCLGEADVEENVEEGLCELELCRLVAQHLYDLLCLQPF